MTSARSENPVTSQELDRIARTRFPQMPHAPDAFGIGIVGAGFIVRDCHLPAYRDAGFRVVGLTSRTRSKAEEVASLHGIGFVAEDLDALLDNPEVAILDIAVPPAQQPELIHKVLKHRACHGHLRGILAQKPLALSPRDAWGIIRHCEDVGVELQVNQNMRYDPSVRIAKNLLAEGILGSPVLATIDMRAVPHWMPWARDGRSLSTYIMSIHHLDCFRYWLGDPKRVLASTGPDPRTSFSHRDGLNLYILEFEGGPRASAWDDVWAGPVKEGAAPAISIDWRIEGTAGVATGRIGWPGWPDRVPSTVKFSTRGDEGVWHELKWETAWFPDAFAGTMAGLMTALEQGTVPDISGSDNLKTIALCEAIFRAATEHRVVEPQEILDELQQANH